MLVVTYISPTFIYLTENLDYTFVEVSTNNLPAEWQVNIEDDDIALEFGDELELVFTPRSASLIPEFERNNQFVRSTLRIYIEDNDSKTLMWR